jgi:hypothetical protein
MNITYSECLSVAVIIQHAIRMRRIMLLSVACLALPFFFILSHKRRDFWGKNLSNVKCVFGCSLQLLSETFLILGRNERDKIANIYRFSCKVPVILVLLNETGIFLIVLKNTRT